MSLSARLLPDGSSIANLNNYNKIIYTMDTFSAINLHISLVSEPIFHIGSFAVTNAMVLGTFGLIALLWMSFYVALKMKRGQYNRFVGLFQWSFEILYRQVFQIVPDKVIAKKIAPLAITIFLFVLVNYWLSILPGMGSITYNGVPLFRGLTADLNFTIAIAIITMITVQIYAVKHLGWFKNGKRYFRNPFKDPIGWFEGLLDLIGEVSRGVSLALRLFGNAFAGETLLLVITVLSGFFATIALPVFMAFEMFIGFIQAYVFYILTLIFTSLPLDSSGHSSDHSSSDSPKLKAEQLE